MFNININPTPYFKVKHPLVKNLWVTSNDYRIYFFKIQDSLLDVIFSFNNLIFYVKFDLSFDLNILSWCVFKDFDFNSSPLNYKENNHIHFLKFNINDCTLFVNSITFK